MEGIDMNETGVVVNKITDDVDRRDVMCTTYQMRNCFKQFADGVAREVDVHCYFQHAYAADLMHQGGRVLDVCCGRGLLIPFLRYRAKRCGGYVGVDIEPRNAVFAKGMDPRRPQETKTDWGFPVTFVESNVSSMSSAVDGKFQLIVYTSAIEHMQVDAQRQSLHECRALASPGATLYLTCPITQPGNNGYDAQYAAHVYEPKQTELVEWLTDAGWTVKRTIGLVTKSRHYRSVLSGNELTGAEYLSKIMPREQALPTIAAMYPRCALEIAMVCQ